MGSFIETSVLLDAVLERRQRNAAQPAPTAAVDLVTGETTMLSEPETPVAVDVEEPTETMEALDLEPEVDEGEKTEPVEHEAHTGCKRCEHRRRGRRGLAKIAAAWIAVVLIGNLLGDSAAGLAMLAIAAWVGLKVIRTATPYAQGLHKEARAMVESISERFERF